jgi:hypothetical protein
VTTVLFAAGPLVVLDTTLVSGLVVPLLIGAGQRPVPAGRRDPGGPMNPVAFLAPTASIGLPTKAFFDAVRTLLVGGAKPMAYYGQAADDPAALTLTMLLEADGRLSMLRTEALDLTWDAMPAPEFVIAVGACAISGGPYAESSVLAREFLGRSVPALFVPGCPPHPLTIIDGILDLLGVDLPVGAGGDVVSLLV